MQITISKKDLNKYSKLKQEGYKVVWIGERIICLTKSGVKN